MSGRPGPVDNARWATFDCYGTLVDWNAGIQAELERLFGADQGQRLLTRYHELEPRVQREDPQARYRRVMADVLAELAHELGIRSVWINRLGERAEPAPTRELADLDGLADVLDGLVP